MKKQNYLQLYHRNAVFGKCNQIFYEKRMGCIKETTVSWFEKYGVKWDKSQKAACMMS